MAKRLQLGPEIEHYTQMLVRDPDSLAFVPLADAYRKSGLFEESFAVLKRGMTRRPDYLPAQIVLGKCYLDLGNYPKAESTFNQVLSGDPENLVVLACLADVRLHQNRLGEAATVFRRILALEPSNLEAQQHMARLEGKPSRPGGNEVIEIDLETDLAPQPPAPDRLAAPEPEQIQPEPVQPEPDFEVLMHGPVPTPQPAVPIQVPIQPEPVQPEPPQPESVRPGPVRPVPVPAEPEEENLSLDVLLETEGASYPPAKVPPPPETAELESLPPGPPTEVMEVDDLPPVAPPVKSIEQPPLPGEGQPGLDSFSSWLSALNDNGKPQETPPEPNPESDRE